MALATWRFAEAKGIPDSPMRRIMLDLARFMDGEVEGDQLALASTAYTALLKEFDIQFEPKSPLQHQLEYVRLARELKERTGVPLPEMKGDEFVMTTQAESPRELAEQLGYADGGRAVREILRKGFPEHDKHARWEPLTLAQINYVKAHLSSR